jgi:hypothetical protein
VPLASNRGGSGDNYSNTTFDDSAAVPISSGSAPFGGTYGPETPLSVLNGIPANGTWKLRAADAEEEDTGTLVQWKLVLTSLSGFACSGCTPTLPPPGEVAGLKWSAGDTAFWTPTPGASEYRIYRGTRADIAKLLTANVDSCTRATTAGTTQNGLTDAPPIPGSFYWWLVRAANATGEGPVGNASAGPRALDSSGTCP